MRYFLLLGSCVVPLHWHSFLIYCIYNRNRIKVIELEYCPWCNTFRQHGPWTETLFAHGTYWHVINTAGEHGSSVASLTLSDSRAGDKSQTSNVDNNRWTLNCVVCLDWRKMYTRVLLVILVVLSAVLPPIGTCNKAVCYKSNDLCIKSCANNFYTYYCLMERENCFKCIHNFKG